MSKGFEPHPSTFMLFVCFFVLSACSSSALGGSLAVEEEGRVPYEDAHARRQVLQVQGSPVCTV